MKKHIIETLTNAFKPDVRVYKEAVYLVRCGYRVTILCWDREPEDNLPIEEEMDGIHVVRFRIVCPAGQKKDKTRMYLGYLRACKKYLNTHPCDYVHCNDISGAIVGYFAKKKKTPMVVDMHEFFESGSWLKRKLMHQILVFIFKKSEAGLYENAAYLADSYKSVRDRLYPLRNYPDSSMVECRPKSPCDDLRVGFHGWIRPNMFGLKALFEAVDDMPGVRVDINGGGPGIQQLKEWSKDISNVYIHGPFDGTTAMSGLYENTDVTFCGYDKNDPNYQGDAEVVKYYESIRTGTPMIMTEGLGMGEKVKAYGFGITCDTFNKSDVAAAVKRFRDDRVFWKRCSENEIKEAPNYCWESAVKILDDIYLR